MIYDYTVVRDFSWCGLSVNFKNGIAVSYYDTAECSCHHRATIDNLRQYLLNGDLRYPKVVYNKLNGVGIKDDKKNWKNWRHDMLFLSLGVAGVEYVKTEGWKYVVDGKEVPIMVESVLGSITIILQKNDQRFKRTGIFGDEEWFCADRVFAVKVPRGRKVLIPAGYYVVFVNNSLNPAAISIIVHKDAQEVPSPFSQSRGAAYYAIKKNARQEIVPNPLYRNLSPLSKLRPEVIWAKLALQEFEDLLYNFLAKDPAMFKDLLSGSLNWDTD